MGQHSKLRRPSTPVTDKDFGNLDDLSGASNNADSASCFEGIKDESCDNVKCEPLWNWALILIVAVLAIGLIISNCGLRPQALQKPHEIEEMQIEALDFGEARLSPNPPERKLRRRHRRHRRRRRPKSLINSGVFRDIAMLSPTLLWVLSDMYKWMYISPREIPLPVWERADRDYARWFHSLQPRARPVHATDERSTTAKSWWMDKLSKEYAGIFESLEQTMKEHLEYFQSLQPENKQWIRWAFTDDCRSWNHWNREPLSWAADMPVPLIQVMEDSSQSAMYPEEGGVPKLVLNANLERSCVRFDLDGCMVMLKDMELDDVRVGVERVDDIDFTQAQGFVRLPLSLLSTGAVGGSEPDPFSPPEEPVDESETSTQLLGEDIDVVWSTFISRIGDIVLFHTAQSGYMGVVKDRIEEKLSNSNAEVFLGDIGNGGVEFPQIQLLQLPGEDSVFKVIFRHFRLPQFLFRADLDGFVLEEEPSTPAAERHIVVEARSPVVHGEVSVKFDEYIPEKIDFQVKEALAIVPFAGCIRLKNGDVSPECRMHQAVPWAQDVVFEASGDEPSLPRASVWPAFLKKIIRRALAWDTQEVSLSMLESLFKTKIGGILHTDVTVQAEDFRHWLQQHEDLPNYVSDALTVDMLPIQPQDSNSFYLHCKIDFRSAPLVIPLKMRLLGIPFYLDLAIRYVEGPVLLTFVPREVNAAAQKEPLYSVKFSMFLDMPVLEYDLDASFPWFLKLAVQFMQETHHFLIRDILLAPVGKRIQYSALRDKLMKGR